MKQIAVFLAEGFEEIEAVTTIDILRRAGLHVTAVAIGEDLPVTGAHGLSLVADEFFDEMDFDEVQALVLPGGMPGTLNLQAHQGLEAKLKEFAARKDRYVAAICAAPLVLGELGLLQGRQATCYPGFEASLKGAVKSPQPAVADGNTVTADGPGHAQEFALKLVEVLLGADKAQAVAQGLNR